MTHAGYSQPQVDVTALVCVYNGMPELADVLQGLAEQQTEGRFSYEALIVDNNSTDSSGALARDYAQRHPGVFRVLAEGRQGKSYALNTGFEAARGRVCAVVDADHVVPSQYLGTVWRTFCSHPEAAFVGGRVLPIWQGPAPGWLRREMWSPLAICDYGDSPRLVSQETLICLLAGSFVREVVLRLGGYRLALGVYRNHPGGVEDDDIYWRLTQAGWTGVYNPEIVIYHKVPQHRLTKRYHRRWHSGHGRYYAAMRRPGVEASRYRLLDVPGHVYRQLLVHAGGWGRAMLGADSLRAFSHELEMRFLLGFIRERWRTFLSRTPGPV